MCRARGECARSGVRRGVALHGTVVLRELEAKVDGGVEEPLEGHEIVEGAEGPDHLGAAEDEAAKEQGDEPAVCVVCGVWCMVWCGVVWCVVCGVWCVVWRACYLLTDLLTYLLTCLLTYLLAHQFCT